MAPTRDFRGTVQARSDRDPAFRKALLLEGIENLLAGDVDTGKAMLLDYSNATVGFGELAEEMQCSPKSIMRMFSPSGNPRAQNLLEIVAYLQQEEHVHLKWRLPRRVSECRPKRTKAATLQTRQSNRQFLEGILPHSQPVSAAVISSKAFLGHCFPHKPPARPIAPRCGERQKSTQDGRPLRRCHRRCPVERFFA